LHLAPAASHPVPPPPSPAQPARPAPRPPAALLRRPRSPPLPPRSLVSPSRVPSVLPLGCCYKHRVRPGSRSVVMLIPDGDELCDDARTWTWWLGWQRSIGVCIRAVARIFFSTLFIYYSAGLEFTNYAAHGSNCMRLVSALIPRGILRVV
jgi:hypothetical protein